MINDVLSFAAFVSIKWALLKVCSVSRETDNVGPSASSRKLHNEVR